MTALRPYVVMTYARCGATWLAQLLGSTGVLGRPEDWFNGQGYRDRGNADYPLDRAGQRAMWHSRGASSNHVVGLKLSPVRLDALDGFAWSEGLSDIRFIHLVRHDRLARAISDAKAQQTRQYRATSRILGEARYDAGLIARCIADQARDEVRVRSYFARNGVVPLEISYEDMLADHAGVLAKVAALMGVTEPVVAQPREVDLEIQRDGANHDWAQRFVLEHANLDRLAKIDSTLLSRVRRRLTGK